MSLRFNVLRVAAVGYSWLCCSAAGLRPGSQGNRIKQFRNIPRLHAEGMSLRIDGLTFRGVDRKTGGAAFATSPVRGWRD